jgi:SAM-dependent methyltransferase
MLFPFVERKFDAAVIAVRLALLPTTSHLLHETLHALRPGGRLALVVWAPVFPSRVTRGLTTGTRPGDTEGDRRPEARASWAKLDWVVPFVDLIGSEGFRNIVSFPMRVTCEAPSYGDYMDLMRSRFGKRRPPPRGTLADPDESKGPVPLEAWSAVIVADHPHLAFSIA